MTWSRGRIVRTATPVAILSALGASGAAAGYALTHSDSSLPDSSAHHVASERPLGITVSPDQGPFFGRKQITLAEAEQMANFAKEQPDDPLASDSRPKTIWGVTHEKEGGKLTQLAFEYNSGIKV